MTASLIWHGQSPLREVWLNVQLPASFSFATFPPNFGEQRVQAAPVACNGSAHGKPGVAANKYELSSHRRCLQVFLNRNSIIFGQ
jgi:hypothetical protein